MDAASSTTLTDPTPSTAPTPLLARTVAVHDRTGGEPFARLDVDRATRTGLAEAVYSPGKTPEQCVAAVRALLGAGVRPVIATRCDEHQAALLRDRVPGAAGDHRTLTWQSSTPTGRTVAVVTAGTADQTVSSECTATLAALGHEIVSITDVGVAGIQRLLARVEDLRRCDALVVIAGMEGALPTAVAGLVDTPLVAVPTSAGYGSSLDGVTALLSMTASCAPGVSVVGIDNGFGAACVVTRWLNVRVTE